MLHDKANNYVKHWREVESDWSQEAMLVKLYNANQSGNPPYSYMATPQWVQQGYDIIAHCIAVDAERAALRAAASGK